MKTRLSLVIPLFNEAENIKELFAKLNAVSPKLPHATEVILVDDGSTDETVIISKKTKLKFSKKIISFSKNFGHQAALVAGLRQAAGELVVTMDGDLQHPPELILSMIKLAEDGYDIVLTQKIDTVNHGFKKLSSLLFYRFVNLFSDTEIVDAASDYRLLNRRALTALLDLPEHRKFLRGLVNWIGFRKIILPFEVQPRAHGTSKYSLKKMIALGISGVTSFSTLPLYFAGGIGLILSLLSMVYGAYTVYQYFSGSTVSGWASMLLVLLVIGSFLFIFLGIIGVYLAGIYDEVKRRPEYIIKEDSNE